LFGVGSENRAAALAVQDQWVGSGQFYLATLFNEHPIHSSYYAFISIR